MIAASLYGLTSVISPEVYSCPLASSVPHSLAPSVVCWLPYSEEDLSASMQQSDKEVPMKTVSVLAGLGALAMGLVLILAFVEGDFIREGRELIALRWGIASLVDLYVAFLLFSAWILYREGIRLHSVVWTAAVMLFGSLAICLFVLFSAHAAKQDWDVFFRGPHARSKR